MARPKGPSKYSTAVEDFIKHAKWLTEIDQPWIVAARKVARELDVEGSKAPLVGQYLRIMERLEAKKPKGNSAESDPLEAMLDARGI